MYTDVIQLVHMYRYINDNSQLTDNAYDDDLITICLMLIWNIN